MGECIEIRCECCGHTRGFSIGVGMMYGDINSIIKRVLHSSVKKQVIEMTELDNISSFECSEEVYECESCDTLHNRTYFKMEYGDREVYETFFRCGQCRKSLRKATKQVDKYRCIKCGEYSLLKFLEILWD